MAKVAFRNDIRTGMRVACANNPLLVGQKRISCFTIDPRSDIFTEVLSFEAFVHFFPTHLHTGIYAPALTVWRNYFGTDALKVWSYNAFTDSPASAYSEALHHITGGSQYSVNASSFNVRENTFVQYHTCEKLEAIASCAVRIQLYDYYARYNDDLGRDYPELLPSMIEPDYCC